VQNARSELPLIEVPFEGCMFVNETDLIAMHVAMVKNPTTMSRTSDLIKCCVNVPMMPRRILPEAGHFKL